MATSEGPRAHAPWKALQGSYSAEGAGIALTCADILQGLAAVPQQSKVAIA